MTKVHHVPLIARKINKKMKNNKLLVGICRFSSQNL